MKAIFDWLWTIPPGVSGGLVSGCFTLVAAVIALVGVIWTLRAHRHREQRNQQMEMRQQVYFETVEANAKVIHAIGRMSQADSPQSEFQDAVAEFQRIFSKFRMVGDYDGVDLLCSFNEELMGMFPVHVQRFEFLQAEEERAAVQSEVDTQISRLKQLRSDGTDKEALSRADEEIRLAAKKMVEAYNALRTRHSALVFSSTAWAARLEELQFQFEDHARKRFDFGMDKEAYATRLKKSRERLIESNKAAQAEFNRMSQETKT